MIPTSTGVASELPKSNKVKCEKVMKKHNNHRKQYQKDQQTIKSFDKLYRKNLQEIVIDTKRRLISS